MNNNLQRCDSGKEKQMNGITKTTSVVVLIALGLALDGIDLADTAAESPADRVVYSQFQAAGRGIHMALNARWKYVYSAGDDAEFLFDRQRDPREVVNLATDRACALAIDALKSAYLRFARAHGRADTVEELPGGGLEFKRYPRVDESYLADPDAQLLFQDYPSHPTNLPRYQEQRPMLSGRI